MPYIWRGLRRIGRFYGTRRGKAIASYVAAQAGSRFGQWARNRIGGGSSRNAVRSGNGVTNQYDAKTVYRRRRMPRRRRRRWVKFVKKVHAAQDSQIATRSVFLNNQLQIGGSGSTTQGVGCVYLYGWRGTNAVDNVGSADVQDIRVRDGNTDNPNEKFKFVSGVLDITANNIGATDLEVDVYEVIYTGNNILNATGLAAEYTIALANTDTIPSGSGGGMTAPGIVDRGWTPFNASLASQKGFKVLKKRKYFLKQDETFTYQVRDPKNRWFTSQENTNPGQFAKKGVTRMLFFIVKPVTGAAGDVYELLCGCTRSYHYKIYQDNKHYDAKI